MKAKFLLFGMVMAVGQWAFAQAPELRHRQTSIHPLT